MAAQFSTRARIAIERFAEILGCAANAAPDQSYGFVFARSGTLSVLPTEDGERIIVALARAPNRSDIALQLRFFALAGLQSDSKTFVHAGMAPDETMVLAVDLNEDGFDVQSLDNAVSRLIELQQSVL